MGPGRMRVTIVGNSGSGKSTLAKGLAKETGATLLDLDSVYWEPNRIAVPRDPSHSKEEVATFCATNGHWIIEGCYASLAHVSLPFSPTLVFLNISTESCVAHCRGRPWEPHKYASKVDQDAQLAFLLQWVATYSTRNDDMSLIAHRKLFDDYRGRKYEFLDVVSADKVFDRLVREG